MISAMSFQGINHRGWFWAWIVVGVGLGAGLGRAESVTLRPVADTTLFENNPGNNLGQSSLAAGSTRELMRSRALVRFDLSGLPASAVITSARVTFTVVRGPSEAPRSTFDLRRVLVAWNEGEGGGADLTTGSPAAPGEATWDARGPGAWGFPGGQFAVDFAATPSASVALTGTGLAFASSAGLLADVQSWRSNPAQNFGWVLLTQAENTSLTARRFGSREFAGSEPTLTLEYTAAVTPDPVQLIEPERQGELFRFKFAAAANQAYTVEFRDALAAGGWSTLTAIPAGAARTVTVEDSVTADTRFYRVRAP